ncbi:hypothetical protein, partial [Sutterella sp.]|uniref:hypothetical protein n=1 Tax=Sutterella sp. TaxID=1981025 RepID=UPI0026DF7BAE
QTVTVVLVHDGEPAATDAPAFVTDSSQAAGEEGGEGDGEESPLWKALLADAADAMETPLCELDAITNFHGEGFASYIAFLRRQALHDYPWFREAGGTAFCPLTTVLVDQADEENLDFGPDEVLATAVGIWAIEKICISYTLEVLYDAMQSRDWWHGYTCDWVLEHFTSWALWLQLPGSGGNPNVDPMNASGYLAGLTANEEGYSIWFQHLEDETDLTTSDFFEVPLIPGKTLGEIFENVQFGHFDFEPVEDEDVIDQAGDGDDEEKDSDGFDFDEVDLRVSELAEVALPLLVIAIGDEHARTVLRTDRTCTRTELIPGATLPRRGVIDVRGTAGTGSDEFRRAVTGDEILYIRMEKDIRRDLN